jgi:hypothetical protein
MVEKGMRPRRGGEYRAKHADEGGAQKRTVMHRVSPEIESGVQRRSPPPPRRSRRSTASGRWSEDLHLRWGGRLSTACGNDHQIAALSVSASFDELPDRADRIDDRRPRRVRLKGLQRLQRAVPFGFCARAST